MLNYIGKRLLQLIPIFFGITIITFALMYIASGDAIDILYNNTGTAVPQEVIDAQRERLGLNEPFLVQYVKWLTRFLTGDMGYSYVSGKSVFDTFLSKLPATLLLAFSSIIVTIVISIPLGILSAVRHNRFTDYLIRAFTFIGNSFPGFFVSLVLIYIFSIRLELLPVMGDSSLKGLILPTLTLSISMASKYTRQVRAIVLDELNSDYVTGAKSRGVGEKTILLKSVLKSSMIAIVTLLALSIGSLLGGTAIIESIFMWEGVGKLAVDSIMMRDYPMIQTYVVWMAIIYVLINLLADITYSFLDPRVRLGKED